MKELEFEKRDQEFLLKKRGQIKASGEEEHFCKIVQNFMTELPEDICPYEKKLEEMGRRAQIHPYTMYQLFLLENTLRFREIFQKRGYEDRLFLDTMKDLKWKMQECKEAWGIIGNFTIYWYLGFFRMERFALGRLQFEVTAFQYNDFKEQGVHIKKGDPVINVHIPVGEALSEELREASFSQAMEFFANRFSDGVYPFFGESWMLDPDMINLLPDGNIKKFAELFTLLEIKKQDSFGDGWRIFGTEWKKKPEQLPRKTRLQKQIAEFLEEGGKLGSGTGIFIRKQVVTEKKMCDRTVFFL